MKAHRLFLAGLCILLAVLLGGAALRGGAGALRADAGQAARQDREIPSASKTDPVWDPVDRYWERDPNEP